jgi:hypothetical protein
MNIVPAEEFDEDVENTKEPLGEVDDGAADAIIKEPLGPDELDPLIKDSDPPGPEIDRPPSMTTDPPDDD